MRLIGTLFVVACGSVLVAAPVPKALKRGSDAEGIVGAWEESPNAKSFWVFFADGMAGVGDPVNPQLKALYSIDPSQTPKHLDWSQDGGKSWYLGVYELDGDTLKISFGGGGNGIRPPTVDKGNGFQFVGTTRRAFNK